MPEGGALACRYRRGSRENPRIAAAQRRSIAGAAFDAEFSSRRLMPMRVEPRPMFPVIPRRPAIHGRGSAGAGPVGVGR